MAKEYHPSADPDFIIKCIEESDKIIPDSKAQVGDTIGYVKDGTAAYRRRQIIVKIIDDQIPFNQATYLAIHLGFIHKLLDWYEKNRGWKEGAYIKRR